MEISLCAFLRSYPTVPVQLADEVLRILGENIFPLMLAQSIHEFGKPKGKFRNRKSFVIIPLE
jgi:hypothetical protein